ncbi:MAG: hypothetical protein JW791_05125 [Nanoarchaeota archaeon]|nr:hypothetical protein [Nanoarchaeota archaeon]
MAKFKEVTQLLGQSYDSSNNLHIKLYNNGIIRFKRDWEKKPAENKIIIPGPLLEIHKFLEEENLKEFFLVKTYSPSNTRVVFKEREVGNFYTNSRYAIVRTKTLTGYDVRERIIERFSPSNYYKVIKDYIKLTKEFIENVLENPDSFKGLESLFNTE